MCASRLTRIVTIGFGVLLLTVVGPVAGARPTVAAHAVAMSPVSAHEAILGMQAQPAEADAPQPVGRSLPSPLQRAADSVILVFVLVVLAVVVVAALWMPRWSDGPPLDEPGGEGAEASDRAPDRAADGEQ